MLLADVNGDGAKTLADELRQASVQADVTRTADIQRMLDLAYQRWGRLDVLFNNAGIAEVRRLLELTEDEWDRTLAVNLRFFRVARRRQTHAPSEPDCGFGAARKVDPDRVDRRLPGWSGVHGPLRR